MINIVRRISHDDYYPLFLFVRRILLPILIRKGLINDEE
jgi:hypothetical protein